MSGASKQHDARGFTLIELLVSLSIIAFAAGVIALNVVPPRNAATTNAERFAARIEFASDTAILSNTMIGVEIDQTGVQFYRYFRGQWEPLQSRELSPLQFTAGVSVEVVVTESARANERDNARSSNSEAPAPTIFFSPTGEATPFRAQFRNTRNIQIIDLSDTGEVSIRNDKRR